MIPTVYHERGLAAAIVITLIGIWIIARTAAGKDIYIDSLSVLPSWLLITVGLLFQLPTILFAILAIMQLIYEHNKSGGEGRGNPPRPLRARLSAALLTTGVKFEK